MKAHHAERLLRLAAFLDALPRRSFNLMNWYQESEDCGTVACAVGWACTLPEFRRAGLTLDASGFRGMQRGRPRYRGWFGFKAAEKFFGLDSAAAERLFSPEVYPNGSRTRPQTVARRIRELVAERRGEC
jgi:hypothetical protein